VHPSQGRTLATILERWLAGDAEGIRLPDAPIAAAERIRTEGVGAFSTHKRGDLAEVRAQEIAMLANRIRGGTGHDGLE
jgi:hypothetical protein